MSKAQLIDQCDGETFSFDTNATTNDGPTLFDSLFIGAIRGQSFVGNISGCSDQRKFPSVCHVIGWEDNGRETIGTTIQKTMSFVSAKMRFSSSLVDSDRGEKREREREKGFDRRRRRRFCSPFFFVVVSLSSDQRFVIDRSMHSEKLSQ
jgi:hypothetical protein